MSVAKIRIFLLTTKNSSIYFSGEIAVYINEIPCFSASSLISCGQIPAWISPIWAFRNKSIHKRD
jgi:hypothetical protein